MKRIIITAATLIVLSLCSANIYSQEEEKNGPVDVNIGVDLMSRFIWRGINLGGSSPSIQPYFAINIKGFELGVWGAYSLSGDFKNQEYDLYASYTFAKDMFTFMVIDYYSTSDVIDYNYFDYSEDNTGHFYEASLSFNGTENIPVTFTGAVIFYGADAITLNDDPNSPEFNTKSGIQYSNYFELGYNAKIKDVSLNPFIGLTLNDLKVPDLNTGFIGETGFYGTGPGVINLGLTASKDIQISDKFSLPLTCSFTTNPQAEKVFFVVGISF